MAGQTSGFGTAEGVLDRLQAALEELKIALPLIENGEARARITLATNEVEDTVRSIRLAEVDYLLAARHLP